MIFDCAVSTRTNTYSRFADVFDVAGEAPLRDVDDLADGLAIVGEVHRVEVARDGEELIFVGGLGAADLVAHHGRLPCAPSSG